MPVSVYCISAKDDDEHLRALRTHTALLRRTKALELADRSTVELGALASDDGPVARARLVLVLLTAAFFDDEGCWDLLTGALRRRQRVVPLRVQKCEVAGSGIELLEALYRQDPATPNLADTLVRAYVARGRDALARGDVALGETTYDQALKIRADDPAALAGKKRVASLRAWQRMEAAWGKDDDEAIQALESIHKNDPEYRSADVQEKLYALLIGRADRRQQAGVGGRGGGERQLLTHLLVDRHDGTTRQPVCGASVTRDREGSAAGRHARRAGAEQPRSAFRRRSRSYNSTWLLHPNRNVHSCMWRRGYQIDNVIIRIVENGPGPVASGGEVASVVR